MEAEKGSKLTDCFVSDTSITVCSLVRFADISEQFAFNMSRMFELSKKKAFPLQA
jgi:hypothetical protein